MKPKVIFIQGGGLGAYHEDGKLVASLGKRLGAAYEVPYPQMPKEDDPDYQRWKPQIRKELAPVQGKGDFNRAFSRWILSPEIPFRRKD